MVTNVKLKSKFKAFSQDYKGTNRSLNQLCEKVNSIKAKLKELSTMKGTLDRLPTVVLGKFPAMIDQDPKSFNSSLVVAPILPSSSIPFSSINSYGPRTS